MVTFFPCFERMCEIRHTRDWYTNRRFLSLRIMARCFSHAGANCEMQISNYLREWVLSGTDFNSYYDHDMLLDKPHSFKPADLENAPLYLTHSKPDNGHAPFRIEGA